MRNSDANIAIDVLNKLIAQELEAASAGMRFGDRPLEERASIRYHAYLTARDEIRKALADAVEERDARNPFQCQRDELVTQDMHTCDLCGRRVSSPVYAVHLAYMDQAKSFGGVCRLHVADEVPAGEGHFVGHVPAVRKVAGRAEGDGAVSWKFKVVPLTYTTDRDAWTLTLNNAESLESLLSEGWSVVRTDVLPGLNGKGEYKVPPNTCFEPSLPPTLVYILGQEAE